MGFLDQLRMQNIFPSGNGQVLNDSKPFGMPDLSRADINPDVVNNIVAKHLANFDNMNSDMRVPHVNYSIPYHPSNNGMAGGINPAMMPGTSTTKPMDTVWGADSYKGGNINPLDRAKLDISRQKLDLDRTKADRANELGQGKLDLSGELGRGKLDMSQQRADTADFKAKHPNAQVLKTAGGNYALYDPATKTIHDSGISTGTMSQEDFINANHGNRMEEIGARTDSNEKIQKEKGENNLAGIAARVAGAKEKQKIGALPTQQKVDYANKAQKLINTRPELADFIKFNTDGTFNIVAPSNGVLGGHHGPTDEQYKQISDAIYGTAGDINLPADKSKETPDVKAKPVTKDPAGLFSDKKDEGDDFSQDDEE